MRRLVLCCALFAMTGQAHAQSPLTDYLEILAPGLTVSVFREFATDSGACSTTAPPQYSPLAFGSAFICEPMRQGFNPVGAGLDAAGAFYQITPNVAAGALDVVRSTPNGDEPILRLPNANGLLLNLAVDVTSGRLYLVVRIGNPVDRLGIVAISGLPQMFDTLLTYIPGGQLSALMPAHPDGFRSDDSVQVWTGDLRSMPDWSQAQPLTCEAATNPAPGQVITVADTLPDPPVGMGRYYITASVNGPDRRLGRQYVNSAFSARNPAGLPVCQ